MASKSETGHAKNVANFEKLIAACKSFKTKYNPSNDALTLTELQKSFAAGTTVLKSEKDNKVPFQIATNERQIAIAPLSKLTTRVTNSLEATKATAQTVADAKTIARKIKGERATTKPVTPTPPATAEGDPVPGIDIEVKRISVSQMSFDSRIDNLDKFVTFLLGEPLYKPNETELQTTTLSNYLADLRKLNSKVIDTTEPYVDAIIDRNKTLYTEETGLVDIALETKKYVISVFGTSAPEYKKISKLKFTRPRKKK
jgi:hypothetical protein